MRRLINNKKKLQETLAFYGIDFDLLENTGVKNIEKSMNVCTNPFWKDVLSAWKEIVALNIEYTWEYFLNMPLWFNEKIKIENEHKYNKNAKVIISPHKSYLDFMIINYIIVCTCCTFNSIHIFVFGRVVNQPGMGSG